METQNSGGRCSSGNHGGGQEVGEDEPVALHDFTGFDQDRREEHGSATGVSVELAVLPARINAVRKVAEELRVERASGEAASELARIDAGDVGAEARLNHFPGERP